MRTVLTGAALVACLAAVRCGGNTSSGPTPPTNTPPGDPNPLPPNIPPPVTSEVFVGAGDIAMCDALEPARQTGQLLRTIGGTVFVLGDNAYFSGSAREYRDCYDPTWGSERGRTRPVPGNHEYDGASAGIPYFSYFGTQAGTAGLGYYSYDLGAWHIIALNSNLSPTESSPQGVWLRNDLAANRAKCTLAYWHHPLFTSSQNGPQNFTRDFWRQLYAAGADVVLNGHDHDYERFAPQNPSHVATSIGIREFVVGTGGAEHTPFTASSANSQVFNANTFGALKLTLHPTGYNWQFVPEAGRAFTDSGSGPCH